MKTKQVLFGFVAAASVLFATSSAPAQSEESSDPARSGTSTVILQFDEMNVSQGFMETFYRTLNEEINRQDEMYVVEGGEVTIDELIVTVGCEEPNPECLTGLQEYVEADRIVFGSIQRSGDAYLFSIKLFDFAEERFLREVPEQSVEGEEATVQEAIPAIVESLIYGDTGTLRVTQEGVEDDSARIFVDGKKMGVAPAQLENLPLGQHAVTVRTEDDREKTKLIVLRHDQSQEVQFDFGTTKAGADDGRGSPALPYTVTGVGLAGLAVGIVGHAQNAKFSNREQDLLCAGGGAVCGDGEDPGEVGQRAADTARKVENTALLSTVGYSVGLVGIGVGGYMLFQHYSQSPESPETQRSAAESFRIRPSTQGVSVEWSVDF